MGYRTDEVLVPDIRDRGRARCHERDTRDEIRGCGHGDTSGPDVGGQDLGAVNETRCVDEEAVEEDEPI